MLVCDVPLTTLRRQIVMTNDGSPMVPLRVSNNKGSDLSTHSVSITIKPSGLLHVMVTPLVGYTSGGTSVSITFDNAFAGPILCRFETTPTTTTTTMSSSSPSFVSTTAYRVDPHHYFCITPAHVTSSPSTPSSVTLTITDDTHTPLYHTTFLYLPVPQIETILPSKALQRGVASVVTFVGTGFTPLTRGRFRYK